MSRSTCGYHACCRRRRVDAIRTLVAPHAVEAAAGLPPFQGGAAGYLAYYWGRVLERLPASRYDDLALPDVVLGIYDWVLAWDHDTATAWLISTGLPETAPEARARRARERASAVRERLRSTNPEEPLAPDAASIPSIAHATSAPSFPVEGAWWDPRLALRSSFTHGGYLDAVARVREYIFAGDIFQANLSQRFDAPLTEPAWALYRRLRSRNAAPFAAYLDFRRRPCSAHRRSFPRDTSGHVETRPIEDTALAASAPSTTPRSPSRSPRATRIAPRT